ncbi:MAG TPA: NUDIX domain-containing protein [Solirubrobacteraceae bacterium]|jgi:8-oxo-dGTP pyrophosphatase MutT (NUDIX family)|nr:NUDIX domain-containing protein [Solirubrobacteraceae bacterium]
MVGLRRIAYRFAYRVLWLAARVRAPRGRGAAAVLLCDGEVLLVRHSYGPDRWELPGGGVRRREEPAAAIARELEEELGLTVTDPVALCALPGPGRLRHHHTHIYRVEVPEPRVRADPVEIAEAAWFDPASPPRPLGPMVQAGLRAAGV